MPHQLTAAQKDLQARARDLAPQVVQLLLNGRA